MSPVAIAVASVTHGVPTLSGTLLIMLSNDLAPADRLFVERHTVAAHRAPECASRHATRVEQLFEEGDWEGAAQEIEHAQDYEAEAGDIPAPPLTLPARHSLGGFEHDTGDKSGEAG
jgi:hypothetical protein